MPVAEGIWRRSRRLAGAALMLVVAASGLIHGGVAAHASLISAQPEDGDVIPVTDAARLEVSTIFGDILDPARSSLELVSGDLVVATGGVPDGGSDFEMRLVPPSLAPGSYTLRWVAVTSDDGAVERGMLSFTVVGPVATGDPSPPVVPAPEPSAMPGEAPASPTETAAPTPLPTASPAATTPPGGGMGGGDVSVPLLGLAALLAAAAVFLRRPRTPSGSA